jgi:DNA-binding CsgD family transcriptional regulator
VATQGPDEVGFDWLTASRARVLRELADDRTEREAAERLGLSYTTVRSAVQVLRGYTGYENVHDLRRWWRQNRESWAGWVLEQGGVSKNST